jgi:hypothetical protein
MDRSLKQRVRITALAGAQLLVCALVITSVVPNSVVAQTSGSGPASGPLVMNVEEARNVAATVKGAPINDYKYLIVREGTGSIEQNLTGCVPATDACEWPSVRSKSGFDDIVTQGDQADFAASSTTPVRIETILTARVDPSNASSPLKFGPGKYLVSVLAGGHKLGGAHFSLGLPGSTGIVTVKLDAYPLPLATLRMKVFKDTNPVDGTFEVGAEEGIPGFIGKVADPVGAITTDFFGNPLCTQYARENGNAADLTSPIIMAGDAPASIAASPGCVSDIHGDIVVPNMGPNRYATTVAAPAGQIWAQTTTLEGGHDWDEWLAEGATGYDTELIVGSEPAPMVAQGFVPGATVSGGTGTINGRVVQGRIYIPAQGGTNAGPGLPIAGSKIAGPVKRGWVTLSDLQHGDALVHRELVNNANGTFSIGGVPSSDYLLTFWDDAQNHILDFQQVTVRDGEVIEVGNLQLQDWFTEIKGTVFVDTNENGKRDPGEVGVPNQLVAVKTRNNSLQDQGQNLATTDSTGAYNVRQMYPMTRFFVLEMFNPIYRSTGITYQADNGPETTLIGPAVDINVLPIIGLSGRVDWGIRPYSAGTNGGLAGTITYDAARNELDPAFSGAEDFQPGIPDIPLKLYKVPAKNADGTYPTEADGSVKRDYELNDPTSSERWKRPVASKAGKNGCDFFDLNGAPMPYSAQGVLSNTNPQTATQGGLCVEAPFMSTQVAHTAFNDDGTGGTEVNGNWGFGDTYRNQFNPNLAATKLINKLNVAAQAGSVFPPPVPPTTTTLATTTTFAATTTADATTTVAEPTTVDATTTLAGATTVEPSTTVDGATTTVDSATTTDASTTVATTTATTLADPTTTDVTTTVVVTTTSAAGPTTVPAPAPTVPVYLPQWAPLHCLTTAPVAEPDYVRNADCNSGLWAGWDNYDFPNQALLPSDYMVALDIPKDIFGKPLYKATAEESINVFNGDILFPAENFKVGSVTGWSDSLNHPASGAGDGNPGTPPSQGLGETPSCAGAKHVVHVTNEQFLANGGSPFEGQNRFGCDVLIAKVKTQKATAPTFFLYTDVPIPTHFWGITINDLSLSYDPRSTNYGEAYGIPNVPVGIYDWKGELVSTVSTDFNGLYETVEPSTSTYNCPTPSGVCPGIYRFVANDPGQPGKWNPNYSNRYRSISAQFPAWPGLWTVTDEAPTSVGVLGWTPGTNQRVEVNCSPTAVQPQIFSVDRVQIALPSTDTSQDIIVNGIGFRPGTAGVPRATLVSEDGQSIFDLQVVAGSSDTQIKVRLRRTTPGATGQDTRRNENMKPGVYHLVVKNAVAGNPKASTNGVAVHVTSSGILTTVPAGPPAEVFAYDPIVTVVAPGAVLQTAIDAAAPGTVLVVPPAVPAANNPFGARYENLIIDKPLKLQGFGPGGTYADGTRVNGSVLSGLAWSPDTVKADSPSNGLSFTTGEGWFERLAATNFGGTRLVAAGSVITVLAPSAGANTFDNAALSPALHAAIDGFQIREGQQKDFPGNINTATGQVTPILGLPITAEQGGGIFLHAYAKNTAITNNVIISNAGAYGAGIRIGTPYVGPNEHNEGVTIARNSIRDNGGVNLAGGIGIFNGSDNYTIKYNDICGNFSVEYGGGISHYGLSQNGVIEHNRVWLNESFDEGGGIMLAGELTFAGTVNQGSGRVVVDSNLIEANIANDDGGGLRMLQVNNHRIVVSNNMIVNNVSTHEGGGIALDDAPDVIIKNDTIARNVTTATAATSDGLPSPAGIASTNYSDELAASRPGDPSTFSNPLIFNTLLWENRAGHWDPASLTVQGLKEADKQVWDLGINGSPNKMTLRYSGVTSGVATKFAVPPANNYVNPANAGNRLFPEGAAVTPFVNSTFQVNIQGLPWRNNANFIQSLIIAADVPADELGDFHLRTGPFSGGGATGPNPLRNGAWDPLQPSNQTGAVAGPHVWPAATKTFDEVAPLIDIDNQCRGVYENDRVPQCAYNEANNGDPNLRPDMGADQRRNGGFPATPFPPSFGTGPVTQRAAPVAPLAPGAFRVIASPAAALSAAASNGLVGGGVPPDVILLEGLVAVTPTTTTTIATGPTTTPVSTVATTRPTTVPRTTVPRPTTVPRTTLPRPTTTRRVVVAQNGQNNQNNQNNGNN